MCVPLPGLLASRDPDDFCEEHPDVVILCTSILSTEAVLSALPVGRLKRSTLFVDVLSVKEFPKSLFLQVLQNVRSAAAHVRRMWMVNKLKLPLFFNIKYFT